MCGKGFSAIVLLFGCLSFGVEWGLRLIGSCMRVLNVWKCGGRGVDLCYLFWGWVGE